MSLDGRIARANGAVDFLRTPKEHPIGAFFAPMDTAIMGRKTLDAGLRMTGGKLPKTAMKMHVMSRTAEPGERGGVVFVNEPPGALVARLRKQSGTRTAWHIHPLGQTLIVTAGSGWAQREGGPVEEIRPGDVVWFSPGEKHWHGATPTTAMTHIAIQEKKDGKVVEWMEKVSDEQYLRAAE
jgi:quercetin dioxygenase-like cupin family protein